MEEGKKQKSLSRIQLFWPHGLYSPGQNTGVGSLSLFQGIFPTQGSNQVSCIAGRFFTSWATREAHLWKWEGKWKWEAHLWKGRGKQDLKGKALTQSPIAQRGGAEIKIQVWLQDPCLFP